MSEKESYKSPELNSSENDEVEIDWMGYLRKLIAARKALLWSVIIGVVLGIVIALSMPKEYTVAVTLSPEMGDESKSAGGLASLASSFLGGSTASGGFRCTQCIPFVRYSCLYPICFGTFRCAGADDR